jgi:Fungal specific transcription factor domain
LERKVDALTARLAEKGGGHADMRQATEEYPEYNVPSKRPASPLVESGLQYRQQEQLERGSPEKRRRIERHRSADVQARREDSGAIGGDIHPHNGGISGIYNQTRPIIFDHRDVDRRISQVVDAATAKQLFNRYLTQYMPRFPAVTFPPGTDAETLRRTKPILFLAILSSTCYGASIPAETQMALEMELRDVLADSLWKKGEKSLEIIQSLQVATLWYRPPANFEQHMFYQMVHVSAFMAIDIGIGKRIPPQRKQLLGKHWPRRGLPDPESAEVRRAWLTSYFLCTSISMILRRPILFRFTDYARECLEYLETAEDALASDKILCQHVRFARICEEIAVQFALDDPAVSLSISDGKVTYGIKHFEKDLAEIVAKPLADHGLKLTEHVTSLYLHEIALHSQNNVEDFKTPFTEETFKSAGSQTVLGPHHVDALTACNSACHEILDTFLSYDFEILFTLPVIFCKF